MRIITAEKIRDTVADLCVQANLYLRKDVLAALKSAYRTESNKTTRKILKAVIDNAAIAGNEKLAICQDTGLPVVFVELGQEIKIKGDFKKAINEGVESGYKKASLRNSIVGDPLTRNKSGYSPAVIHIDVVKGADLKLTVLPKGFGSENKTLLKMFKPTARLEEIKSFIIDAVKSAGPDACPPYVIGIGIGGTADYACVLAKKALLKKIGFFPAISKSRVAKQLKEIGDKDKLAKELLGEINRLNIGPMGLGGKTTALGVNIQAYPTHIAGLPVCVNISCHALRSAGKVL